MQPPIMQMHDAVGLTREFPVVRYENYRKFVLVPETEEQIVQTLGRLVVQIARRLVRQKEQRLIRQRPRHRHPLSLTAGQLRRLVATALLKPHRANQRSGPLLRFRPVCTPNQYGEHDILKRSELTQQVVKLENEANTAVTGFGQLLIFQSVQAMAIQKHLSGRRLVQSAENVKQGTFPSAARSGYRYDLPDVYL
jgi:hypothetical protein